MLEGVGAFGYTRAFCVGSNENAGFEDLGGYVLLREVHSCGSTNG